MKKGGGLTALFGHVIIFFIHITCVFEYTKRVSLNVEKFNMGSL
jgi:hypothetical protein